jgi:hypothetical protein
MTRSTIFGVLLLCGTAPMVSAQYLDTRRHDCTSHESAWMEERETCRRADVPRASFQRAVTHYGKWLSVLGSAALIVLAEREHDRSRRDWNTLLDICRSAQDACALGSDGRYVRDDAEQLFQRSRSFDRRANRWLLGAQAGLLATTALFIIDLHPADAPGNIPYPPVRVGMRVPF